MHNIISPYFDFYNKKIFKKTMNFTLNNNMKSEYDTTSTQNRIHT